VDRDSNGLSDSSETIASFWMVASYLYKLLIVIGDTCIDGVKVVLAGVAVR